MKDLKQFIKTTIREFLNENTNNVRSEYEKLGFTIKPNGVMEKDGVTIILLTNKVYEISNGNPLVFDAFSNEKVDIIELIQNIDVTKIGKGFASKVLDDVITISSKLGRTLQLYPQPLKNGNLDKKTLQDWYIRKGFIMRDDGVMVKNP